MRARYFTGNLARKDFSEWVCPEHGGFATDKFVRWWPRRGGLLPCPRTTQEAVDRSTELRPVAAIVVVEDGKYWRVKDVRFGERKVAPAASVLEQGEPDEPDNMGLDAEDFGVTEMWGGE
jgi:hypothetical protein